MSRLSSGLFRAALVVVVAMCACERDCSAATVRLAAAQPKNRTIDWKIDDPAEVLRRVDTSLGELEQLIRKAADAKCDALAFPEDTLGLLNWEAAHPDELNKVLPIAIPRMLERLGRAAAAHKMYLVLCSDTIEPDGAVYNTAYLLGRDGKEIGRYHKVNLPLVEQNRKRGEEFPVFKTPDLGDAGMLICYDMVFPEAARCLALGGADVIFHPTLGGAAIGGGDISLAAFRTRAVENFVYLVVAMRGHGSMIISPQGKVLATADEPDGLAIADVDLAAGREGGDAFNMQRDMRGRLFRERVPQAYRMLVDPAPPVLAKVPSNVTSRGGRANYRHRADRRRRAVQAGRGARPPRQACRSDSRLRSALRGVPHFMDRPRGPRADRDAAGVR